MSFGSHGSRLEKIRRWLRREASSLESTVEGGRSVATPPPGAVSTWTGDPDRETSTNAQMEGAADEPWGGS
jgi:hypothetical protein